MTDHVRRPISAGLAVVLLGTATLLAQAPPPLLQFGGGTLERVMFVNASLVDAVALLANVARAKIELAPDVDRTTRVTANFAHVTIEEALRALAAKVDLTVARTDDGKGVVLSKKR